MVLPAMNREADADPTIEEPVAALICEGSQVQRSILKKLLQQAGFCVSTASNGAEAVQHLTTHPTELLITGLELGDMTGIEICWHVKSCATTAHIYTMVVTASSDKRKLVESLDSGADDFVRKPFDEVELQARLRAATRIIRMQRHLKALAGTDALTGVANRRSFLQRLAMETARAGRYGYPLSVAMVDLDHFKHINDSFGHAIGDDVIVASVLALCDGLREHDLVGRLGGEEFAILIPETIGAKAAVVCERLRGAIAALAVDDGKGGKVSVTASIGVASMGDGDDDSADRLLQIADDALYAAKRAGRNRVHVEAADG